jgi:hypothetical protein
MAVAVLVVLKLFTSKYLYFVGCNPLHVRPIIRRAILAR